MTMNMGEDPSIIVFIAALLGGIFLSLYFAAKGIDPEEIGRKAYRQDNPADNKSDN
jgi:hypothetical protein